MLNGVPLTTNLSTLHDVRISVITDDSAEKMKARSRKWLIPKKRTKWPMPILYIMCYSCYSQDFWWFSPRHLIRHCVACKGKATLACEAGTRVVVTSVSGVWIFIWPEPHTMCPVRCERGVWVSEIREHTISLSSRHHHQAQGWAISIGGSRAENQKYSQCPWFWHFLAILNFLVISRPKLKFNNTFFRTDLALEFWKSMKDFRDFFRIGPLYDGKN